MNLIYNSSGTKLHLQNLYRDSSCFLLCTGPSINDYDLSKLNRRGILTAGVNNISSIYRTNFWFCVDQCTKFSPEILLDPGIMKFIPQEKVHCKISTRNGKGQLKVTEQSAKFAPNVFTYIGNTYFDATKFLFEETVNWGMHKNKVDELGGKGGRSVFYAALKILFYLGIRRVYLLGVDFDMREEQPYAFPQRKHAGGIRSNNSQYALMNERIKLLKPYFDSNNFIVKNCNMDSKLEAFEKIPYELAIDEALQHFPENFDITNMYDYIDMKPPKM